jgi:hypothetical protein
MLAAPISAVANDSAFGDRPEGMGRELTAPRTNRGYGSYANAFALVMQYIAVNLELPARDVAKELVQMSHRLTGQETPSRVAIEIKADKYPLSRRATLSVTFTGF